MHREGHVGAGLLAYAPVGFVAAAFGFRQLALLGGIGVAVLAMVPDWDQRVPFIAHRGPTHTIFFALAVAVVGGVAGVLAGVSAGVVDAVGLGVFGFTVGAVTIGSHIAADALTPAGVRPFAPYRNRHYTYEVATASNPIANYALLAVGGVAALAAFAVGTTVASLYSGL